MTKDFGQLTAPNYSAKTKLTDFIAYCFAGFLLFLPVLPIAEIKYYFAIFTLGSYVTIFLTLTVVDFVKAIQTLQRTIWQIQYLRFKIAVETQ